MHACEGWTERGAVAVEQITIAHLARLPLIYIVP